MSNTTLTLTDALQALGINENTVTSWREATDRFIIITGPAFQKHEILKIQIRQKLPLTANIQEITSMKPKPISPVESEPKKKPSKMLRMPAKHNKRK